MTTNQSATPSVAKRIAGVERSMIRYMFDKAQHLNGNDLVHLEIGEPDYDTPTHVLDAANEAVRDGATHYTSNAGIPELRSAIAKKTERDNGVWFDPKSEITVTVGAMEALHLALLTITEPGDEVIIPSPAWPNYETQAILAGGTPVDVPLDAAEGFQLDTDALINQISENTAAVILCSPSNPTGQVLNAADVRAVAEVAADHGAYVIADEVYEGLVYGKAKEAIASQVSDPEMVLSVNSVSKKYAMTGWRLGWLAGAEQVIQAVTKIHESTTACASAPSQHAALEAISGVQEPFEEMKASFHERRDYVFSRISAIDGIWCPKPEGAFYAFVDMRSVNESSLEVAESLLYDHGVVVAPGGGFGDAGEGFIRLSFANSLEQLELGLDRIEAFVEENR